MNRGYQSPLWAVMRVCLVEGWISRVRSFMAGPFSPRHPASLALSLNLITPDGWMDLTETRRLEASSLLQREGETVYFSPAFQLVLHLPGSCSGGTVQVRQQGELKDAPGI